MCYNSCQYFKYNAVTGVDRCAKGKNICPESVFDCDICGETHETDNLCQMHNKSSDKEIYVCPDCYDDAEIDGYSEVV